MPLDTSLNGIRARIIDSLKGRRIGMVTGNSSGDISTPVSPDFVAGVKGYVEPIEGFSSGGTTITSTSVTNALSAYGFSVVGATGASGTTAYSLNSPVPGTVKKIFNPTTGTVTINLASGSFLCSTGSAASTQAVITFAGKGSFIELYALTTALWGVGPVTQIGTGGAAVTFS